jgi:hypothetical protein
MSTVATFDPSGKHQNLAVLTPTATTPTWENLRVVKPRFADLERRATWIRPSDHRVYDRLRSELAELSGNFAEFDLAHRHIFEQNGRRS